MENNNETRAVFINAGENRVMLNPLKGQWEHKGKKVNLWFNVPNGAREFVYDALDKTMGVNNKGEQVLVNNNMIVWEMPVQLMVLKKNSNNEWYLSASLFWSQTCLNGNCCLSLHPLVTCQVRNRTNVK